MKIDGCNRAKTNFNLRIVEQKVLAASYVVEKR